MSVTSRKNADLDS